MYFFKKKIVYRSILLDDNYNNYYEITSEEVQNNYDNYYQNEEVQSEDDGEYEDLPKNSVIQYYNTTTTKPQRYYTNAHRNISINRINFKVVFDTGALSNTISKKLANKLHIGIELKYESYSIVVNSNKMLKYRYTQK